MGKKNGGAGRRGNGERIPEPERGAQLRDLLSADTLDKLKAQADAMKRDEAAQAEARRQAEEAEKKAERKRQENDFAYLLEHSNADWRKHK